MKCSRVQTASALNAQSQTLPAKSMREINFNVDRLLVAAVIRKPIPIPTDSVGSVGLGSSRMQKKEIRCKILHTCELSHQFDGQRHQLRKIMDTEDLRCQYQSTNCENPRAYRGNGSLHRLCELHRDKANETQRRWQSRRKKTTPKQPKIRVMAFEKRARARLMAVRCARQTQRRESRQVKQHLSEPTVLEQELAIERMIEMSDDEIQGLSNAVMEFNESDEPRLRNVVDEEFVSLLDSWSRAYLVDI